jgi:hypothetical protein
MYIYKIELESTWVKCMDFQEAIGYHSFIIPMVTRVSEPVIDTKDLSRWESEGGSTVKR